MLPCQSFWCRTSIRLRAWSGVIGSYAPLQAVARKLAGYPRAARMNMHHARCRVPAAVAHILRRDPQLVSPAVEAFYARDAAGMKAAARMVHFPSQVHHYPGRSGFAVTRSCLMICYRLAVFLSGHDRLPQHTAHLPRHEAGIQKCVKPPFMPMLPTTSP